MFCICVLQCNGIVLHMCVAMRNAHIYVFAYACDAHNGSDFATGVCEINAHPEDQT